jgi:catechol 2,3-dioxygenase-like lactoylglutathione lyase family enzyme
MLSKYPIYAGIPVTDLEKAKAWYLDKLGLEPEEDAPLEENPGGIFLRAGAGTRFFLFVTYAAPGSGATVAEFAVGDEIEEVVESLRARGVVFEDYDIPGVEMVDGIAHLEGPGAHRVAWFKDLEGNVIALGGYGGPPGD